MIEFDNKFETMDIDCDNCSYSEQFEGSYLDCIATAKENDWLIRKSGDEYLHYCSDCRHEV